MAEKRKHHPGPGRPFKPGQSGNPGGRPDVDRRTIREMARQHTHEAIATLVKIMQNGEMERNRLSAAEALLNRGWGTPTQHVEARIDFIDTLAPADQAALANALAALAGREDELESGARPTIN